MLYTLIFLVHNKQFGLLIIYVRQIIGSQQICLSQCCNVYLLTEHIERDICQGSINIDTKTYS